MNNMFNRISQSLKSLITTLIIIASICFLILSVVFMLRWQNENIIPNCTSRIIMDSTYAMSEECWVAEECKNEGTFDNIFHGMELSECQEYMVGVLDR